MFFASKRQSNSILFCALCLVCSRRCIYCVLDLVLGAVMGVCTSAGTIIFLAHFHQMNIHDVLSFLIGIHLICAV